MYKTGEEAFYDYSPLATEQRTLLHKRVAAARTKNKRIKTLLRVYFFEVDFEEVLLSVYSNSRRREH